MQHFLSVLKSDPVKQKAIKVKFHLQNSVEEAKTYAIEYCRSVFDAGVTVYSGIPLPIFQQWSNYTVEQISFDGQSSLKRGEIRSQALDLFNACEDFLLTHSKPWSIRFQGGHNKYNTTEQNNVIQTSIHAISWAWKPCRFSAGRKSELAALAACNILFIVQNFHSVIN